MEEQREEEVIQRHQNQLLISSMRNKKAVAMQLKSQQDLNKNHETESNNKKSSELLRKVSFTPTAALVKESPEKLWSLPFNLLQTLLRECSVILIVLETIILLLGYCVLVGLHFSFRHGYLYLRGRNEAEDNSHPFYDQLDDHDNPNYEPIPVPRSRTARG